MSDPPWEGTKADQLRASLRRIPKLQVSLRGSAGFAANDPETDAQPSRNDGGVGARARARGFNRSQQGYGSEAPGYFYPPNTAHHPGSHPYSMFSCFRCAGRGFVHDSALEHDRGTLDYKTRCAHCKVCPMCDGRRMYDRNLLTRCSLCNGRGNDVIAENRSPLSSSGGSEGEDGGEAAGWRQNQKACGPRRRQLLRHRGSELHWHDPIGRNAFCNRCSRCVQCEGVGAVSRLTGEKVSSHSRFH